MSNSKEVVQPRPRRFGLNLDAQEPLALHIIYGLYALSLVSIFPAVVGLILTWVAGQHLNVPWLISHQRYQMRTFLIMLVATVIGLATQWLLIGFVILALVWCWFLFRTVKGWLRLSNEQPIDDP
ncbi:MAG: hypothetical protein VX123_01250, partial [Pseudomonadota bacterium]|nr:hypothetical protein [Pseudomonadota bacterium]